MRTKLTLLLLGASTILFVYGATHPVVDFIVYWAAAHNFVQHHNPYSIVEIFQIQRAQGWTGSIPIMMLAPPWVLPLIEPLGYSRSYFAAWLLSAFLLISATALASRMLMDLYFGSLEISEISHPKVYRYLFAFTFYPVLLSLKMTQMGVMLLLAMAGFAYFQNQKRPLLAALFLSATILKPHLFILIWIVVLLKRQWTCVAVTAGVIALLSGLVLISDHQIFREYVQLMTGDYPRIALAGILGGVRSALEPHDTYWLQFIPPIVGIVWFVFYWRKHRFDWNWKERLPGLILASFLSAPYGFIHDQTLLVIPIVALAASALMETGAVSLQLVLFYTAMNIATLLIAIVSTPWSVLPAPIFLVLWFRAREQESVKESEVFDIAA